jgi:hypothetical protein
MSGSEAGARGLRWDGTVTAGNALTALAMCAGMLIWGMRLEGRVDATDHRTARLEVARDRDDRETQALAAQIGEMRGLLAAIRDDQRALRALLERERAGR